MTDCRHPAAYIFAGCSFELPGRSLESKINWEWGWILWIIMSKIRLNLKIYVFRIEKIILRQKTTIWWNILSKIARNERTGFKWNQNNSKSYITPSARFHDDSSLTNFLESWNASWIIMNVRCIRCGVQPTIISLKHWSMRAVSCRAHS